MKLECLIFNFKFMSIFFILVGQNEIFGGRGLCRIIYGRIFFEVNISQYYLGLAEEVIMLKKFVMIFIIFLKIIEVKLMFEFNYEV